MSINKIVTLTVAGVASVGAMTAVLAGGPEYAVPSYAGFYIEGNLGYAYRPWQNNVPTIFGLANQLGILSSTSNINGGFTGGADIGYQFNQFFAIEGGWNYLPKVSGTVGADLVGVTPVSLSITSGLAYAAFKGTAPIYNNTYIFGKLGAVYTYNSSNVRLPSTNIINNVTTGVVPTTTTQSNYWNPMLAAGIQYYFTPSWSVNVQYAYIPGFQQSSSSRFITPESQLITAGLGYKFLM
jgi:opacity protein-like surface antigen